MNKSTIIWQLLPVCIRKDLKYCLVCFPDKTSLSPAPNAPQNSGSRTPSTPLTPSTQPGSLAGSVAQSTSNTNTCTTTTTGSRGLERSMTPDLTQEDLPPEFSFDPSVLDADRADGTRGLDVSWVCTTAIPPLPFTTDPPPPPAPPVKRAFCLPVYNFVLYLSSKSLNILHASFCKKRVHLAEVCFILMFFIHS